jgi:hypothetical protein
MLDSLTISSVSNMVSGIEESEMNDDANGPGRPVSRDEPYYAEGTGPGQTLLAHCHLCGELVPVVSDDYRWFIMRAIKAGWRLVS